MPWLIAIDWACQSLQKLPTNAKETYFEYSQSIAKSLISHLHSKDPYDFVSVLVKSAENQFEFTQFLNSKSISLEVVDNCPRPADRLCILTKFTDVLFNSIQNIYSKFNSCQHIRLVVLTDGYGDFVNPDGVELKIPERIKGEITCLVINHSGCQIPFRLNSLKYNFSDYHVHDNKSLSSSNEVASTVMNSSSCEINATSILSIGHLSASVSLFPSPCIRHWKQLEMPVNQDTQFFLEVFGFLQVNDMGHPPIVSRHTMVHSSDTDKSGGDMLRVLLESLKGSHTAAILNIYIQPRVEGSGASNKDKQFVTHGFISESNGNGLYLSFFGEVGAEFQYSSWLNNSNGPSADVNKIFRLCKKLPEKADFFLKELNRVMALAEVLGWTELTQAIQTLLPTHISQDLDVEMLRKVYHTARMKLV